MLPEKIGYITVFIQLIGISFYIRDMFRGTTKPNLVSWFIWALAPIIGSYLQWEAGARFSVLPVFMAGFNPILVIIFSFVVKRGYWKITKFDIYCGVLAIFSLALWIITKNLFISVLFAILSDALASLPTIIKAWRSPETETVAAYTAGIISNILGLLIIQKWTFPIYSLGVYFILMNIIVVLFIYRKKFFFLRAFN